MAWTEFYVQTTGSDLNAGSTTADAASLTYASGNWDGTSVFTVASGNPSSDGVAVGDWVSVYANGSTATSYVAQVTARDATTITLSTTAKYGSAPASGTGTRTAKVGGAQASLLPWDNYGSSATPTGSHTRVNIKNGTYTHTASLALDVAAAVGRPIWYRGYNTTPGDLDMPTADLAYPALTFNSTFSMTISTGSSLLSGCNCSFNRNGVGLIGASGLRVHNCIITNSNTSANAAVVGYTGINATILLTCCYASGAANTPILSSNSGSNWAVFGCTIVGNNAGTSQHGVAAGSSAYVFKSTIRGVGGRGVSISTNCIVIDCTFKDCGSDAIYVAGDTGALGIVANNVYSASGGYDHGGTGTRSAPLFLRSLHHSPTSGQINTGVFGDWGELGALTDSGSPFVSSTDLHLLSSSAGAGAGMPGQWTNVADVAYPDLGAWQRQAVAHVSAPLCAVTAGRVASVPY